MSNIVSIILDTYIFGMPMKSLHYESAKIWNHFFFLEIPLSGPKIKLPVLKLQYEDILLYPFSFHLSLLLIYFSFFKKNGKQVGAEMCQAQNPHDYYQDLFKPVSIKEKSFFFIILLLIAICL